MTTPSPSATLVILESDESWTPGAVMRHQHVTDAEGIAHRVAFRVVREATFEEWQARLSPEQAAEFSSPCPFAHYYAVEMD